MKDVSLQQALHLLDKAPQPLLLLDNTGAVRGFNQAFGSLVGADADSTTELALEPGLLQPLLGTGTVINWIMPDGDERWLAVEAIEMPDLPGIQARFYTDITEKLRLRHERDALQHELDEQTLYDARINSLLSRRGILVSLAPLVARCRRYNNPLSVIALSISSQTTDRSTVLADVTALLRDQTRWADLVGLNDSEAFIMVLQETTRDAALQMVEKLAARIDQMNDGGAQSFTASYGITECQSHDDADSLLERAEQALVEAGQSNSGRTVAL
jgi:diguanylate cyclase (GGDEF)-like protein